MNSILASPTAFLLSFMVPCQGMSGLTVFISFVSFGFSSNENLFASMFSSGLQNTFLFRVSATVLMFSNVPVKTTPPGACLSSFFSM